jgi:SAM-dependent methyltransferase
MSLKYELLYLLGITPWDRDNTPVDARLHGLIAGPEALSPGRALDLGCGSGRQSVLLAENGWEVTAVDAVKRALRAGCRRAREKGVHVEFMQGDVTQLEELGITGPFDLLLDSGCFHNLSVNARRRYAGGIAHLAPPGATFLMFACEPSVRRPGVRGAGRNEIDRAFSRDWEMIEAAGDESSSGPRSRWDQLPTSYRLERRAVADSAAAVGNETFGAR